MRPTIVECDKKSATIRSLKNPKTHWKIPVKRAAMKIELRYNLRSVSGPTFSLNGRSWI